MRVLSVNQEGPVRKENQARHRHCLLTLTRPGKFELRRPFARHDAHEREYPELLQYSSFAESVKEDHKPRVVGSHRWEVEKTAWETFEIASTYLV